MKRHGLWLAGLIFASLAALARAAETRRVPLDFPTIQSAVLAAQPGDTIEVDDGYYFEHSIILDKPLTLKARHVFRSVIYGQDARAKTDAIFIVRSSVNIEGFTLKNGAHGILQRDSPDVDWSARNLAIVNMDSAAIAINDVENNIGRGRVANLIIDHCRVGIETNDAYGIEVENCFVADCQEAFAGSNHIYFRVRNAAVWNCTRAFHEDDREVAGPRTDVIVRGPGCVVWDAPLVPSAKSIDDLSALAWSFSAAFSNNDRSAPIISRGLLQAIAGDIDFRRGDYERSRRLHEGALRVGRETCFEELIWQAEAGIASALARQGIRPAALEHYREALRVIEELRCRFPFHLYNPGFFKDKMPVYFSLIRLLDELNQENPARGYLEEAFAVAERSKARGFVDALEEAELGFAATAMPEFKAEEARLADRVALLQTQLQYRFFAPEKRAKIESDLRQVERAYTGLLIRLQKKLFGETRRPVISLGYPEIRERLLSQDTALVEYLLGPKYSVAFLATSEDLKAVILPGASELGQLVEHYLSFLTCRETTISSVKKGGGKLNEILLGSFQSRLKKGVQKIIIVPDGPLFSLPFESLVDAEDGRFLIEKYQVSYAQSASALVRLAGRGTVRTGEDLLAVAITQPPATGSFIFGAPFLFSRLRYARREVAAAARFFVGGHTKLLVDAQADEGLLKSLRWKDYRIIHFAVHGIFDDDNWTRSALLLQPDPASREDGYLQARDILPLSLASDLVVLSACQTARGSLQSGEGLVGLTSVFLFAGSRSVLASQWNINDASTAAFMGYFYDSLAKKRSSREALQQAKIKMIRSVYRHPFYWAAFILIGCPTDAYSITKSRDAEASSRPKLSLARTVQR